jgi:CheY-like chemotaxis protein
MSGSNREMPMAGPGARKILIVEDDPDIRETLQAYLETNGYGVAAAANGEEALTVLDGGESPCLILLDMMMPVMDGWAFLAAIGESESLASVPVAVVTAYTSQTPTEGVEEVLRKPVDLTALMETVREHCGPPGQR